jgi:hypothetical protein
MLALSPLWSRLKTARGDSRIRIRLKNKPIAAERAGFEPAAGF